jgi:hypothetical protein
MTWKASAGKCGAEPLARQGVFRGGSPPVPHRDGAGIGGGVAGELPVEFGEARDRECARHQMCRPPALRLEPAHHPRSPGSQQAAFLQHVAGPHAQGSAPVRGQNTAPDFSGGLIRLLRPLLPENTHARIVSRAARSWVWSSRCSDRGHPRGRDDEPDGDGANWPPEVDG